MNPKTEPEPESTLYSLDHAILNIPLPPPSMWMNMGYWKVFSRRNAINSYASLCRVRGILTGTQVIEHNILPNRLRCPPRPGLDYSWVTRREYGRNQG